jgi:hypothetical protein
MICSTSPRLRGTIARIAVLALRRTLAYTASSRSSSLHRNKVKLTMSEVSVHAILARTMQIVSHDSKAKDIAVTLDTSAINDRLVGDPARFGHPLTHSVCASLTLICTPAGCSKCSGTSSR